MLLDSSLNLSSFFFRFWDSFGLTGAAASLTTGAAGGSSTLCGAAASYRAPAPPVAPALFLLYEDLSAFTTTFLSSEEIVITLFSLSFSFS